MGIIREPKGVDFVINSGRISPARLRTMSRLIKKMKEEEKSVLSKKKTKKYSHTESPQEMVKEPEPALYTSKKVVTKKKKVGTKRKSKSKNKQSL